MQFQYNDGGRAEAGYKGKTGDCVVRGIAIITGKPYQIVYNAIITMAKDERVGRRHKHPSNPRTGVRMKTIHKYMTSLGWEWTPTMFIGSGCKVHLREGELPMGRLLVRVSKHITAVIDGVINDTGDCQRRGTRCVYGYFQKKEG